MSNVMVVSGCYQVSMSGGNGVGYVSIPGIKTGDVVFSVMQLTDENDDPPAYDLGNWELVATSDDNLKQLNSADRTARTYTALLWRA